CRTAPRGEVLLVRPSRCRASTLEPLSRRLDGAPYLLGRAGWINLQHPQWPQGIDDRVHDGRRRADGGALTHALDAQWVDRTWRDGSVQSKTRQVWRGRDHVGCQVPAEQRSVGAIGDLFVEGLRDALRQPAMDLAFDQQRVEDAAAVIDRDVALQRDRARLRVDFDDGHVR